MSLQTTLARACAREADEVWQRHRKGCNICGPAARARKYGDLCADGKIALSIREDLRKKAEAEAEADKRPSPDQLPLFTDEDLRGWLSPGADDKSALTELLAGHADLIRDALEDAVAWRSDMDDDASAEAYAQLLSAIEAAEAVTA